MTATAYPLTWPTGFPRVVRRERGTFKTTLAGALKNVEESLRRFASDSGKKLEGLVLSSNVTLGSTKSERHPDMGGSHDAMAELNVAYAAARKGVAP